MMMLLNCKVDDSREMSCHILSKKNRNNARMRVLMHTHARARTHTHTHTELYFRISFAAVVSET